LPKVPLSLGFLARATGNGFFVFGLIEIALAALGASGSWVNAEMLAEVFVAFRFFEFLVFGFSFWIVLERGLVGWAVVSIEVSGTRSVKSTSGSGGLNARAKCLSAQVAHRVTADASQLVTA
jgi:hypothetical protein